MVDPDIFLDCVVLLARWRGARLPGEVAGVAGGELALAALDLTDSGTVHDDERDADELAVTSDLIADLADGKAFPIIGRHRLVRMVARHRLVRVAAEAGLVEDLILGSVDLHDGHFRLADLMAGVELDASAGGSHVSNKVAVGGPPRARDRC